MSDVLTLITLITCLNYEPSLFPLPFCINTFRPLLLEGLNCPYELGLPSLFIHTLFAPPFLEGPNCLYEAGLPSLFVLSAETLSPPF